MTLANTLLIIASLMVLISVLQPLARRLNLPNAVVLAFVGVMIGLAASYILHTQRTTGMETAAELILGVPITSEGFIYIFLPALLFQSALMIDTRRMLEDAVPIFILAVIAVLVSTGVIGLALFWTSGMTLVVCLMVGAVVATTDPAAVVAIFRDLGAPGRLTRLVEGESLLNDATAIVLFTVLLEILMTGVEPSVLSAVEMFLIALIGGAAFGFVGARLAMALLPLMRGHVAAELTLSIAVPYLLFVVGESYLNISGVVAVVVAGLVVGTVGRNRLKPASWQFLEQIWDQLAFLSGSLIFVLAALVVPHLLLGVEWVDVLLVGVIVVAALVARGVVLYGLMPLVNPLRLGEQISNAYKFVIWWGGLRGAVTLALALALTENARVDTEVQRFVAILATGFVLFSLLVGGTTLRPLIRLLQIDRLSPRDQALRGQILELALTSVLETVSETAKRYDMDETVVKDAMRTYRSHAADIADREGGLDDAVSERDRLMIGLVAMIGHERDLIEENGEAGVISSTIMERLLASTEEMADATRSDGRLGYLRTAAKRLRFDRSFRLGHFLHRQFRFDWLLERCVADRIELLIVNRIVLEELQRYDIGKLKAMFGSRQSEILSEILSIRMTAVVNGLDALKLQYPEYAEAIERRFLGQLALRLESKEYDDLRDEALIGPELYGTLKRELTVARETVSRRPKLDLGLNTHLLVEQFPMFKTLDEREREKICGLLRSRLVLPGERLIKRGDRGGTVYFISSGAVEVSTERAGFKLGRGEVFGEMAVLTGERRQADVTALGYCQLLVLEEVDFRRMLASNPLIRARIDAVVEERRQVNLGVKPDQGVDGGDSIGADLSATNA